MTITTDSTTHTNCDYAEAMRRAASHALATDSRVFFFAEGINDPGAYLGTVNGLAEAFGTDRCFDVPNCEDALTGMGVGAAISGLRPVFVSLRVDFLMLAMNQIVNHAARWPSMTGYRSAVPLTIRALIGKSWGQAAQHAGALHSLFANVPGLEVVLPSGAAEGAGLFLAALESLRTTLIIEERGIFGVEEPVPDELTPLPLGQARHVREGGDITLVGVSSMVGFAKTVAGRLAERGISADILDLRTIRPLDSDAVCRSVQRTRRLAVFDIGWPCFGVAAEISRHVLEAGLRLDAPLISVNRRDEHTPSSCFLERDHYPTVDETVVRIEALVK